MSESLLASAILRYAQDAIIAKGLDGKIMSWNEGAERLYGYTADEIVGKPISLLGPPGKWFEVLSLINRVAGGERIEHYETTRVRKDGTELRVSITLSPIKDALGKVVGIVTIDRDVTHQQLIERALREPLPEDPELIVIDKDLTGTIRHWSPGAERFYGYGAEEVEGKPIAILVPPGRTNEIFDLIEVVRQGEQVRGVGTHRITKQGEEVEVILDVLPLTDHGGRLVGVRSVVVPKKP